MDEKPRLISGEEASRLYDMMQSHPRLKLLPGTPLFSKDEIVTFLESIISIEDLNGYHKTSEKELRSRLPLTSLSSTLKVKYLIENENYENFISSNIMHPFLRIYTSFSKKNGNRNFRIRTNKTVKERLKEAGTGYSLICYLHQYAGSSKRYHIDIPLIIIPNAESCKEIRSLEDSLAVYHKNTNPLLFAQQKPSNKREFEEEKEKNIPKVYKEIAYKQ